MEFERVNKMNFLELAKKRYSVRKYQEKTIEEEKLHKILEAGRIAPTGANTHMTLYEDDREHSLV